MCWCSKGDRLQKNQSSYWCMFLPSPEVTEVSTWKVSLSKELLKPPQKATTLLAGNKNLLAPSNSYSWQLWTIATHSKGVITGEQFKWKKQDPKKKRHWAVLIQKNLTESQENSTSQQNQSLEGSPGGALPLIPSALFCVPPHQLIQGGTPFWGQHLPAQCQYQIQLLIADLPYTQDRWLHSILKRNWIKDLQK